MFFFLLLLLLLVYPYGVLGVLSTCLTVQHVYPERPGEGFGSPKTVVTEGCEQLCGYRELNPRPLEEHPVLLSAKLSRHVSTGVLGVYMALHLAGASGSCVT